ncbi:molybdate ABC transporter substrate-binding protein [Thaumasiovibrio sp. DFM-14]|uniref:molybdate ABC transporter substrate-binding protein n=1 Tax=Thaumasiovibrio sp. DFM-14 TaxID=3384792 RepID=UPI0039A343CC
MIRAFWLITLMIAFNTQSASLQVYVASSMYKPVKQVLEQMNIDAVLIQGSSAQLARQINQGAPADLYISAHPTWAESVQQRYDLPPQPPFVSNQLVVIGGKALSLHFAQMSLLELLSGEGGTLAIGDPSHVPAGMYTMEAVEALNIADRGQWIPARHVQHALRFVEIGSVPLGVVFKTDAVHSDRVNILQVIPAQYHSPIVYMSVALTELGQQLQTALNQDTSRQILNGYGFTPL